MERLDAVGVICRLASTIAAETGPVGLRWYRAAPLDAALALPDGRTLGIVRQGLTSDRTGFSKRLWRLREGPLPGAVLMLMPDEVRLIHARRTLDGSHVSAVLALERDAVWAGPSEPVWRPPSVAAPLDLRYVLSSYLERGGAVPREPESMRATTPEEIPLDGVGKKTPGWLLPALLKPAEKRVLDLLYDWPGIAPDHARGLLGVSRARLHEIMAPLFEAGLVGQVAIEGRRLALTDQGLALLARRDRTSVGAARKRWSVVPTNPVLPLTWRKVSGRRTRQLLRNIETHRGGPPLHSRAGEAVPEHGLGADAARSALPGFPLLPPCRRAALSQPRRIRTTTQERYDLAPLPRVGAPRRAAIDHVGKARSIPALLLVSQAKPTTTASGPSSWSSSPDELTASHFLRVAAGRNKPRRGRRAAAGLPPGAGRAGGPAGTRLESAGQMGVRTTPAQQLRRRTPKEERRMRLYYIDESEGPRYYVRLRPRRRRRALERPVRRHLRMEARAGREPRHPSGPGASRLRPVGREGASGTQWRRRRATCSPEGSRGLPRRAVPHRGRSHPHRRHRGHQRVPP